MMERSSFGILRLTNGAASAIAATETVPRFLSESGSLKKDNKLPNFYSQLIQVESSSIIPFERKRLVASQFHC